MQNSASCNSDWMQSPTKVYSALLKGKSRSAGGNLSNFVMIFTAAVEFLCMWLTDFYLV
jgi:hypothetical protein